MTAQPVVDSRRIVRLHAEHISDVCVVKLSTALFIKKYLLRFQARIILEHILEKIIHGI